MRIEVIEAKENPCHILFEKIYCPPNSGNLSPAALNHHDRFLISKLLLLTITRLWKVVHCHWTSTWLIVNIAQWQQGNLFLLRFKFYLSQCQIASSLRGKGSYLFVKEGRRNNSNQSGTEDSLFITEWLCCLVHEWSSKALALESSETYRASLVFPFWQSKKLSSL